jgi:hypothetical protein
MRRRGGPIPYLRLGLGVKVDQATEVHHLRGDGATFAQIADRIPPEPTPARRQTTTQSRSDQRHPRRPPRTGHTRLLDPRRGGWWPASSPR